jgi:hypothetical protein
MAPTAHSDRMNDTFSTAAVIERRELFDRIWSKPMITNATELGTTTSSLSALAKRLGLPLPRAGHWMKKEVGKESPTPEYPADPTLDGKLYTIPAPQARRSTPPPNRSVAPKAVKVTLEDSPAEDASKSVTDGLDTAEEVEPDEHKRVASTRNAMQKSRSPDRVAVGGRGKFRLLVAQLSGTRACAVLDRLVVAAEAKGWPLDNTERGYAISADGETVGFLIEEKLDRLSHVVTAAELREKAEYDHKCALADRGIGYRPWRPPSIPEHDYVPNGELVLKFDHDYAAGGTRRTFSDGKRQRLEDLVPSMIDSLERWAVTVKARREQIAQRERDWAEQERRRKDHERQVRVEGYRITFLQRQIERKREIDGLSSLIATWQEAEDVDAQFAELVEFAQIHRHWLEAKIAPAAIAERIAKLKLMDDDVYVYDEKRLD